MDVSKGSRSASTSITLTVVEGNPPTVWVGQDMKVKASDSFTLEGFYQTSEVPTKVEWSSSQEQGMFSIFKFAYEKEQRGLVVRALDLGRICQCSLFLNLTDSPMPRK